jgi:RNA polymerase sigma factor (TIGR02999 family)
MLEDAAVRRRVAALAIFLHDFVEHSLQGREAFLARVARFGTFQVPLEGACEIAFLPIGSAEQFKREEMLRIAIERLAGPDVEWRNRGHFLALAAQMMRRILVEAARNRHRQKRGGGRVRENVDDIGELPKPEERDVIALSDALSGLAAFDARMSQVVELRFFGGLSVEETADVLNVSPETVMRDWKTAKAWLLRELRQPQADERP